jgi:hypothetical protein
MAGFEDWLRCWHMRLVFSELGILLQIVFASCWCVVAHSVHNCLSISAKLASQLMSHRANHFPEFVSFWNWEEMG